MTAPQWSAVQLELQGPELASPYLELDAEVTFTHDDGTVLRRPVFWLGGRRWAVRFASTTASGRWTWRLQDAARPWLTPAEGVLEAGPPDADAAHPALRHGFARLDPGGRVLRHADGTPAFAVWDTAWALPWRAPLDQVRTYAADRQAKGFTGVLLMSVQPDMDARGPAARGVDEGFAVGFADLPQGRLTRPDPAYFDHLDAVVSVLVSHGLTPVLQPVFFGFGWKGLRVAGPELPPEDYARYCRYLVARYGAGPVVYLPGADGTGTEPPVVAGGRAIQSADGYGHPTGLHYRPHHPGGSQQDADWLDFQACQTGHGGEHVPERVALMWSRQPAKGSMNGEPSYEHTGRRGRAAGWWQGHEAWSNLCAGGTFGVAYGAASLWQWRLHADEPGHTPFFLCPDAGWREALDFEGSRYVGLVGRIVDGLPLAAAAPCWDVGLMPRGLIAPGELYLGYAEHGGPWMFLDGAGRVPSRYWLVDPRTGRVRAGGERPPDGVPIEADDAPAVLICAEQPPAIARAGRR